MKLYHGFEFGKSSFTEAMRRAKTGAGEGDGLDLVATWSIKHCRGHETRWLELLEMR